MYRLFVRRNEKSGCFYGYTLISLWAFLLCSGIGALAQSAAPALKANPVFSIRAITKGDEVKIPSETLLDFTLQQSVTIPKHAA